MKKEIIYFNDWLKNFALEDQQYAIELFNSLQVYSISDLENSIQEQLENLPKEIHWGLFPLTDKDNFKPEVNFLDLIQYRTIIEQKEGRTKNNADSEFVIMHYIRNYCLYNKHTLNIPIRTTIINERIRNYVIITDIIASGKQVIDFLDYFFKDKTLNSYRSLHKIESVIILAHLVTEQAYSLLINHRIKNVKLEIRFSRRARTISSFFNESKHREKIIGICKKYCNREDIHLGYGKVGLLSIYSHRIPNNIPAIFLKYQKNWNSLFKQRRVSKAIRRLKEEQTGESLPKIYDFLSVLNKSKKNQAQILSENISVSLMDAHNIIDNLIKAGYVTPNGSISKKGKKILNESVKPKPFFDQDKIIINKYFPFFKGGGRI